MVSCFFVIKTNKGRVIMYYWNKGELITLKKATDEELNEAIQTHLRVAKTSSFYQPELNKAASLMALLQEHPMIETWNKDYYLAKAEAIAYANKHPYTGPRNYIEAMGRKYS